jgi:hypothetical protein
MTDGSNSVHLDQQFKIAQAVRVLAGPFADAIGNLNRLDDKVGFEFSLTLWVGKSQRFSTDSISRMRRSR